MPEDSDIRAERGQLFVVADGMGGHAAGDVAAELAVRTIPESYYQGDWGNPGAKLYDALLAANTEILRYAESQPASRGMGAACVSLALTDGGAAVAHIGDCRAYRVRAGQAERLTRDHSWVEERIAAGRISDDEARHHPYRNILTRALGTDVEIEPTIAGVDPMPGDIYVLCSDGLWGVVDDAEIAARAVEHRDARTLARALVDLALERGGPDNIAVVVVRALSDGDIATSTVPESVVAKTIPMRRNDTLPK